MDGRWKFDLRDHSFAFPEAQETFHQHIMSLCAFDVVTGHELYSYVIVWPVLFWQDTLSQWGVASWM